VIIFWIIAGRMAQNICADPGFEQKENETMENERMATIFTILSAVS
jgi:hypothetical protein